MMTFVTGLETKASHKGEVRIPHELSDAYFLSRTGWTWQEYRQTPTYLIEQIRIIWHLEHVASNAKTDT